MYSNCVETIAINNILRLHHITAHARGGGGCTYSWPLGLKEVVGREDFQIWQWGKIPLIL